MGLKTYLDINVYEALQRRLAQVFAEFDHIYVSYSGGKDSGLLLGLVVQFMRREGVTRKIGVFHQDFEAQYTETTRYVERTLSRDLDLIQPYWCCLPMSCKTATSMFEQYWIPWDPDKREIWVREQPSGPGVITLDNHEFDFYTPGMLQEDLYAEFGPWYHRQVGGGRGRTIGLVGIRADESLNRWRATAKATGTAYRGLSWTTGISDGMWAGYPLYDWTVEDIWRANGRFGFDYNRLYDLLHAAGVPLHLMRVASPFNDWAIASLKLYRVIEPDIWPRLLGRVNGANFAALYGGTSAVGWKNVTLPPGHTWKSFLAFLLTTLPAEARRTYEEKFRTSVDFWRDRGGVLSAETIDELRALGIAVRVRGKTNYRTEKEAVTFTEYPDDAPVRDFQLVPSYKRMVVCILKNDHLCKFMGFSQTKLEQEKRRAAIEKYRAF